MEKTFTFLKNRFQLLPKGFVLLLVGLFAFSTSSLAQYCNLNYTVANWSKIHNVKLVGNNNTIDNPSTNCNGYQDFTSLTAADLSAGGSYTLEVYTSYCFNMYQDQCKVWIDYNQNEIFENSEEIGYQINTTNGNYTYYFNFTVPCNITTGTTRLRISLDEDGTPLPCGGGTFGYGEGEDYSVSLSVPAGLSSNFFVPDTVYIGTITNMVNANQSGYIAHDWTISDGTTYSATNAEHIFSTAGTYTVKLVSENCLGKDSTTKTVVAIAPTAVPVADFVSNKNIVEIYDNFELIDLSTNGATNWDWYLTNGIDTIDYNAQPDLQGNNPYIHSSPLVYTGPNSNFFPSEGKWTVCLKSSNVVGPSATTCKVDYIEVTRTSFSIGPETSLPSNVITAGAGTIYDKGGEFNDYTAPEANLEALIAPCGAQSVTLNFEMFKLLANANLKIYDGVNALGTPLHPGNGFTGGNAPSGPITASSGAMYLLFNSTPGAVDSGFKATWTSVAGTGAAPIASFDLPGDTIYNAVTESFMNTSQNAEGSTEFEWSLNGTPVATTRHWLDQLFLTNGTYVLTLKVTSCDGRVSTSTQTFVVANPNTPTEIDFYADNRRPAVGDEVLFTAMTDKANRWEWSFFPPQGVTATGPTSDQLSERTFRFDQPGVYAVQLKAYNFNALPDSSVSEATLVKTNYVIVVEHCNPVVSVTTSTDIGINYVSLEEDATGQMWENQSMTGVGYEDFTELGTVELNFGGVYNFQVDRASNTNPMNRKIWIDWNVDGDFDDAGEEVASQAAGTSTSWMGSFTVPDYTQAFEANTIMRVGVSYGTDLNMPCGANSHPMANRIGEFEDYAIRVINDGDDPVITLNDNDTIFIEQVSPATYVTPGATATDPSQGDISANIQMTTDVDQTLTGVYYEVYNVADASGNTAAPVTRVVYVVVDQTPPVLTVNGSTDTTIEVGTPWVDLGATANDAKEGNLDNAIVTSGNVDVNTLGSYTITYFVQDNQNNSTTATRTIHVVDTELPVIANAVADTDTDPWEVQVQLQSIFVDITTATDNYNSLGDNLSFTANPASPQGGAAVDTRFQGTTTVTYTATDESGNQTVQEINYIVRDFIPPVIDLHTLDVVYHPVNSIYTPVAASASDNLYNTTQISLTQTSNVNPFVLGTYQDTYTATDAAGNVSVKVRTVHVVDDEAPVVTSKIGGMLRVGVGSQFDAIDYILFSDNYDGPDVLFNNHTLVHNDINVWEPGLYSATFKTEDNSGNESNEHVILVEVSHDYFPLTGSVTDLSLENILSVSPNPTSGLFNINVNLPENEEITINVFNAVGQQILNVENGEINKGTYAVDITNQANGIYYVQMNVQGSIITKKVVLNR